MCGRAGIGMLVTVGHEDRRDSTLALARPRCVHGGELGGDDGAHDRLPNCLSRSLGSGVLVDLRPPRLVLVGEPDFPRVERADQPLAFGARLVELGEEDRHVAADDD
jgi:hypothetical protein